MVRRTIVVVALILAFTVAVQALLSVSVRKTNLSAKKTKSGLEIRVPIENPGSQVAGHLTVDLLDPQDSVTTHAAQGVKLPKGSKTIILTLPLPKDTSDLGIQRLRCILNYGKEAATAIKSLVEALPMLETRILGQTEFYAGSKASLRIVVLNHGGNQPIPNAEVGIYLISKDTLKLFSGVTDIRGTLSAQFTIPEGTDLHPKLFIRVVTDIGKDEVVKDITIKKGFQILLTSDKPIYQPSQTMHLRALCLRKPSLAPAADSTLVLEVEDGKGNKVMKQRLVTNRFGIAASDFQIADEVNFGRYTLRAILANATQEKTVTVQKYVLPKFKVELATDKAFYLPGETVKGKVQADYFFGKPVANSKVEVQADKFDLGWSKITTITGKTDAKGHFEFEIRLPDYFVGQPLEQGKGMAKVDVAVTDPAQHQEKKTKTLSVSRHAVNVAIIPETQNLMPDVPNVFYVVATYPDGTPCPGTVSLKLASMGMGEIKGTDRLGIAKYELTPNKESLTLVAEAKDSQGHEGTTQVTFRVDEKRPHILLRTDAALYKAGQPMALTLLASQKTGTAFVDVIKNQQTVLTVSCDLKDGLGRLTLDLDQTMTGSLYLHAYLIAPTGDIIRDTRVVYVNPANDLSILVTTDQPEYRPGMEAKISFTVTDQEKHPVLAALGIQVVDEAVFALSENQPGLEKVYFMLEKELLTPRYEIHEFGPREVVEYRPWEYQKSESEVKQDAARILFAAVQQPKFAIEVNTIDKRTAQNLESLKRGMTPKTQRLWRGAYFYLKYFVKHPQQNVPLRDLVTSGLVDSGDTLDAWGNPYKIESVGDFRTQIRSGGPDETLQTKDDIGLSYSEHGILKGIGPWEIKAMRAQEPSFSKKTGHLEGLLTGYENGDTLAPVTVEAESIPQAKVTYLSNGRFLVTNLPPGNHTFLFKSPGCKPYKATFEIRAGISVEAWVWLEGARTVIVHLIDQETGESLDRDASVTLSKVNKVFTQARNYYVSPPTSPGRQHIRIHAKGYEDANVTDLFLTPDRDTLITVSLKKLPPSPTPVLTPTEPQKPGLGKIVGKVADVKTGEGLPGATVQIVGTKMGASTDLDGSFVITNVPVGTFTLQAKMIGFRNVTVTRVRSKKDFTTRQAFKLEMAVVGMKGLFVTDARPLIEKSATTSTRVTTTREVSMPANRTRAGRAQDVVAVTAGAVGAGQTSDEPRLREYFPETLFNNPSLLTDEQGKATADVLMADNITTWRLTAMASSLIGQLGSTTSGIKVFQDFFIDLDLPVVLTQGDQISIPVAIYNYLPASQTVRLEIVQEDWFDLLGPATQEKPLQKNEVNVAYFPIIAKALGNHRLTVKAYGTKLSDAIARQIEVAPDGNEHLEVVSDRLEKDVEKTVRIPQGAIPGASKVLVRIYPGVFAQIVQGLESMLRMPFGCFEQTSSCTYPNILILDYLKQTRMAKPELEMKAREYIQIGYQRLVSFEVPGGGFDWFGRPPSNRILSAYGLLEFTDMSRVHEVDSKVIERTQRWLLSLQNPDGSWSPDKQFHHAESWGRIQASNILPTAYITWALLESGTKGSQVQKAMGYLKEHARESDDPYTLALCANALIVGDKNDERTHEVVNKLIELRTEDRETVFWKSKGRSFTNAEGATCDLEATGLATYALLKHGRSSEVANKALLYLVRSKSPQGGWATTQGTILALKALLLSLHGASEDIDAKVTVVANGKEVTTLALNRDNAEVLQQVDLKNETREGQNTIRLKFSGKGSSQYEIVTKYYLPWRMEAPTMPGILAIDVDYDKKKLAQNDLVTASVSVKNNAGADAKMVIVDLGIPPGFEVQAPDLDALVEKKVFEKYNLTGRQIIIYFSELKAGKAYEFSYRLKAKYPIKAKSRYSMAYEYYNPERRNLARPVPLEVQ
jgi:hypothetical protein